MSLPPSVALEPLPYHRAVCDYLQSQESKLWQWLGSPEVRQKYAGSVRMELLKSTYRLDADAHPAVYQSVDACRSALGLEVPVTVYQSQDSGAELNAMLLYVPDHAHVVLMGPLLDKLDDMEVRAVLAHELGHHILWSADGGDLLTADRVLSAMSQASGEPAHAATESRFSRYTELFCDRAALLVCQQRDTVVSTLVKMSTGLTGVSATAYIAQVAEVLADPTTKSAEGLSHPETFIRARALELWAQGAGPGAGGPATITAQIDALVRGLVDWDGLDVIDQGRLDGLTRLLITTAVGPGWVKRHEAVLAHARLFWNNADLIDAAPQPASDLDLTEGLSEDIVDYLAFVLVDLVAVVGELDEGLLAWLMTVADRAGIGPRFDALVNKELRVTKKILARVRRERERLVHKAGASHGAVETP